MNRMSTHKTLVNYANVEDFIRGVANDTRREDALVLLTIYRAIANETPKLWGTSIIGFGKYHYKSERSSQEGDWPLAGFSPRKQSLTLYFVPGFDDYAELLEKLGKHKTSIGCLYINKLADIDMDVLKMLIEQDYEKSKRTLGQKSL